MSDFKRVDDEDSHGGKLEVSPIFPLSQCIKLNFLSLNGGESHVKKRTHNFLS